MEQADAGEGHRHVVFVAGLDHVVVANGSARLRNIFHAALMCTLDIVTERGKNASEPSATSVI